jgi:phosphoribosylglycinamide formyltransferase-1
MAAGGGGEGKLTGTGRIAVMASGRGSNFEALCTSDLGSAAVVLLVTDNPSAPVILKARRLGIETLVIDPGPRRTTLSPASGASVSDILERESIDLVCLAGFMRILKGPILERFGGRILNVHPSLLPAFPGLDAQAKALEYGVRVSGCTVHYVDSGTDTGPIVLQATVPVLGNDTVESLSERILLEEHRILPLAARLHCEGRISVKGRLVHVPGLPYS